MSNLMVLKKILAKKGTVMACFVKIVPGSGSGALSRIQSRSQLRFPERTCSRRKAERRAAGHFQNHSHGQTA